MIKMPFIVIALLFCGMILFSCKGPASGGEKKPDTVKKLTDTVIKKTVIDTNKPATKNNEYIDWSKSFINGEVPMMSKIGLLYKVMGKPDSITTPDMDTICTSFHYNRPFKAVYIKGSEFEIYGNTAIMSILKFKQNVKLVTPNLILSANTTLESIIKLFPKSAKNRKELIIEDNQKVIAIDIPLAPNVSDDNWLLLFRDGKLSRIDYWSPC